MCCSGVLRSACSFDRARLNESRRFPGTLRCPDSAQLQSEIDELSRQLPRRRGILEGQTITKDKRALLLSVRVVHLERLAQEVSEEHPVGQPPLAQWRDFAVPSPARLLPTHALRRRQRKVGRRIDEAGVADSAHFNPAALLGHGSLDAVRCRLQRTSECERSEAKRSDQCGRGKQARNERLAGNKRPARNTLLKHAADGGRREGLGGALNAKSMTPRRLFWTLRGGLASE